MDSSGPSSSTVWSRRFRPQGKIRRRVQGLRLASLLPYDPTVGGSTLDLSHNESVRLAADALLSGGLDAFHEALEAEGELDFLSQLEKTYLLEKAKSADTDDSGCDGDETFGSWTDWEWTSQRPVASSDSDLVVDCLDLNASSDVACSDMYADAPSVQVTFYCEGGAATLKDQVREFIRKTKKCLSVVVDVFSDVELLCDLLEASNKRNVKVYLILDQLNLQQFINMCQNLHLNANSFTKLCVHSAEGQMYRAKSGRTVSGQISETFLISDGMEVLTGSFSFSWLSWQVHRTLAVLVKGSTTASFHQEFLRLVSSSTPVPGFVSVLYSPASFRPPYVQSLSAGVHKIMTNRMNTVWTEDTPADDMQMNAQGPTDLQDPSGLQGPSDLEQTNSVEEQPPPGRVSKHQEDNGLETSQNQSSPQVQNHSGPLQTQVQPIQTQLRLTFSNTETVSQGQRSNPQGQHGSVTPRFYSHLQNLRPQGLLLQQRNLLSPSVSQNTALEPRRFNTNVHRSTQPEHQARMLVFNQSRVQTRLTCLSSRRPAPSQRAHLHPCQPQLSPGLHLRDQLNPTPRLNWVPQSHTLRPQHVTPPQLLRSRSDK